MSSTVLNSIPQPVRSASLSCPARTRAVDLAYAPSPCRRHHKGNIIGHLIGQV
ncbi:hypothetical protein B0T14DRAFT_504991 [Immersiella caudata]|uniref:Uncharacterized protein n=1 Tax=Immersiella caudata TaxID=314043 RepID=A0AA39XEZ7_9PEZI|nr:hypothetical protein B0T14DRAFT_504991 [Immersiella caudata]